MKVSTMGRAAALLFAVAVLGASAPAPTVPPAARSELVTGGKLRVGLLVTNPVFVTKDGSAGEIQGIAVDLARALAKQLGVPFEPVRYDAVAKLVDGVKSREWDIAFMGFEQGRADVVDFSAPYLVLGSTYLVPAGSPIRTIGDIDKSEIRIGTSDRSAQERYLSRSLKQAQLVRVPTGIAQEGLQLLNSGKVHAIAGNRVTLLEIAAKLPGSRVLEGQFAPVLHSLAVPKGKPEGAAYAKQFIEHAKASGLVKQSIDRSALRGVNVAPPASSK